MLARVKRQLALHGYWLATLAIAASTAVLLPGRAYFAKGQFALLYLLVILLVASVAGMGPGVLAAVLAFLAWNFFFLPPYNTFVITDPKDWLALLAFLVVGIIVGVQTGRMRDREARAAAREREAAALSRLSADLVSETSTEKMAQTVLMELVGLLGCPSATLFATAGDGLHRYCSAPAAGLLDVWTTERAQWVFRHDQPLGLPEDGGKKAPDKATFRALEDVNGIFMPVRSASGALGVLRVAARRDGRPYSPANGFLVSSLANLIGAFLERQRLQAEAAQAEAAREADRLKSSLLSSVSHELKTPLAALTATVSNLLENDVAWDEESARDELRSIITDIARLNSSIGSLLDLSRLEAHSWEPRREPFEMREVVATVLRSFSPRQLDRIRIDLPEDLPLLELDFVQWTRVVRNLLENALLYSNGSEIEVGARDEGGGIVSVWVADKGPGVPDAEHEAVFEKFYRGQAMQRSAPSGTGLGLAITREIVHAHGGEVWVENVTPHGARFVVTAPETSDGAGA